LSLVISFFSFPRRFFFLCSPLFFVCPLVVIVFVFFAFFNSPLHWVSLSHLVFRPAPVSLITLPFLSLGLLQLTAPGPPLPSSVFQLRAAIGSFGPRFFFWGGFIFFVFFVWVFLGGCVLFLGFVGGFGGGLFCDGGFFSFHYNQSSIPDLIRLVCSFFFLFDPAALPSLAYY